MNKETLNELRRIVEDVKNKSGEELQQKFDNAKGGAVGYAFTSMREEETLIVAKTRRMAQMAADDRGIKRWRLVNKVEHIRGLKRGLPCVLAEHVNDKGVYIILQERSMIDIDNHPEIKDNE